MRLHMKAYTYSYVKYGIKLTFSSKDVFEKEHPCDKVDEDAISASDD